MLIGNEGYSQEKERDSQVFFRGGFSFLVTDRGGEIFTDTGGASGLNDGDQALSLGAGIDLAITDHNELFDMATLLGEVYMGYEQFSNKSVRQTTSALVGGANNAEVSVAVMNATIAPKVRFDTFGSVRPFVIPGGMTWLVNSPPSNDSTYLDFGIPVAAGFDIVLMDQLSVGIDYRHVFALNQSSTHNSYGSLEAYAGVNF